MKLRCFENKAVAKKTSASVHCMCVFLKDAAVSICFLECSKCAMWILVVVCWNFLCVLTRIPSLIFRHRILQQMVMNINLILWCFPLTYVLVVGEGASG